MSAVTLKPIRLECYLPTVWRQQSGFVSSRHSDQTPAAVCIGFECRLQWAKRMLTELFSDMRPVWDQRDKNYHNRDLKPKLGDEIGEKLNHAGKN